MFSDVITFHTHWQMTFPPIGSPIKADIEQLGGDEQQLKTISLLYSTSFFQLLKEFVSGKEKVSFLVVLGKSMHCWDIK